MTASHPAAPARRAWPPSVERLLAHADAAALREAFGRTALREAIRDDLASIRAGAEAVPEEAAILARIGRRLAADGAASLRPVFNLTGTVLHTNLGRALLPPEAAAAVSAPARATSNSTSPPASAASATTTSKG